MSDIAEQVLSAVNKGFYKEATQLWGKAEMIIEKVRGCPGTTLETWLFPRVAGRVGEWMHGRCEDWTYPDSPTNLELLIC